MESKNDKVWKLRKYVYDLEDANGTWYLNICEKFTKLVATISKIDQYIFFWKERVNIVGNVICFLDDIIWAGTSKFEDTIICLREVF